MKTVITGDSILLSNIFIDDYGTAITSGTVSLSVYDFNGSNVSISNATHYQEGTWRANLNTIGWGLGATKSIWNSKSATGTKSDIVGNDLNMVGSVVEGASYLKLSDLQYYYSSIYSFFDGHEDEHLTKSFKAINSSLESIGYKLPVIVGLNGEYDQHLQDWNAFDTIYRIVASYETQSKDNNEDAPWFEEYKKRAMEIEEAYGRRKYVLNQNISAGETGIGKPTRTVGSSVGTLHTNSDGFGDGFLGYDFPRTWLVKITGTGSTSGLRESLFDYSRDNGVSWYGTSEKTNDYWISLSEGVNVRFTSGTQTGTENVFQMGDSWTFTTAPTKWSVSGGRKARSY